MTVDWTATALTQLQAIRDYIAQNSPGYAAVVADRVLRRTEQLADLPLLGAEVPEYGDKTVRELLEYSYRIIYRVQADRVEVLAVIHGARRLPRTPPG